MSLPVTIDDVRAAAARIEHGMDPNTPAATIRWGTRPNQETVQATVATLPQAVVDAGLKAPAMTIIGRVDAVRLARVYE